jgi:hypothetical protein
MPPSNPPPYTEVINCSGTEHHNQPRDWTAAFSPARQASIAARRTTAGRGRPRGRGAARGRGTATQNVHSGRAVSFSCGTNHSHRFHCDNCRPTARLEVNIGTTSASATRAEEDLVPLGRVSLNPLASPFASRVTSSDRQHSTLNRRRSISSVRGASPPDTWTGPPARPLEDPFGASPDNSRPSSPVISPDVQLLRQIDCKLRFQVAEQLTHHRISTIFRRLEYICSCSKPKNLCTCSSSELTVNIGLRVVLKTEGAARCESPESET